MKHGGRAPAKPLARYHAAWPEVQVEIQTGTTAALVDAVLNHRIDCALVAHPGTAPRARLTWRTWDRDGRHVAVQ
jgi:DNA-binding transcriptional LysR family regulator